MVFQEVLHKKNTFLTAGGLANFQNGFIIY